MQSHCIGLKKSRYLQAEAGWSGIKNQVKKKKKRIGFEMISKVELRQTVQIKHGC